MSLLPFNKKNRIKNYQNFFVDHCIEMDIKQELSTDNQLNFMGVNRLFVLLSPNQDCTVKRFNSKKYYWPKSIIKNYNVIVNGNNLYDQTINCDVKRYEKLKS